MEHEGVRNLIERLFKKPLAVEKQIEATKKAAAECDDLTIIFETNTKPGREPKANNNASRFIDFKETLKQRLKAKRLQARQEEAEENQIDEEYHNVIGDDDGDEDGDKKTKSTKSKNKPKDSESDSTEQESNEDDDDESANDSDDDNFKLNLDDDDDEETEKCAPTSKGNKQSAATSAKSKHQEKSSKKCQQREMSDIPLTNTIPSNQLTKNSGVPNNGFNEESMLSEDALFLDSQFNKKRRSLDELTNISLNFDVTTTANNSTNNTIPNMSENGLNTSKSNQAANDGVDDEDSVVFDELAFLCSGQFKTANDQTQKKQNKDEDEEEKESKEEENEKNEVEEKEAKTNETEEPTTQKDTPKKSNISLTVELEDKDLYAADGEDDEEDDVTGTKKKTRVHLVGELEDENEQDGDDEEEEEEEEEEDEDEEDVENEEDEESEKTEKESAQLEEEDGEEVELTSDSNDSKKAEKKNKTKTNLKINAPQIDDDESSGQKGFFEDQAELSGSEGESDENFEGDSDGDDDSIIFKGEDNELPSEDELRNQVGQIYQKEQLDEYKREMRLMKEKYLTDGEFHSKNSRRKQYRWKNLDGTVRGNWDDNNSSDDDDEEDDEDNEENSNSSDKTEDKKKSSKSADWRSMRHERELFMSSKSKTGLLSDDEEDAENKKRDVLSDDIDELSLLSPASRLIKPSSSANMLMKRGKELLNKARSTTNDLSLSSQKKRSVEGDVLSIVSHSQKGPSSITIVKKTTTTTTPTQSPKPLISNAKSSMPNLSKNKLVLNKLSSYWNKNSSVFEKSSASLITNRKAASNMMVFASIDINEQTNDSTRDKSDEVQIKPNMKNENQKNVHPGLISKQIDDLKLSNGSEAKRKKLDTADSIFNHL